MIAGHEPSPGGRMDAREVIAANPFFTEALAEAEIATLARRALSRDFGHGLELIREDDSGSSLFIIVTGQVDVLVGSNHGGKRVARLGPGAIVGEMSLMTGARRSATVVAATDVRALEVTKPGLAPILAASPELVDRFAAVLKKRQAELDRAYEARRFSLLDQSGFADLIRGFFGGTL